MYPATVDGRTSIKINFGKYKSTGGDGIPIGAFNVQEFFVVTAGGRILVEELIIV
jgi:hypothetical protein